MLKILNPSMFKRKIKLTIQLTRRYIKKAFAKREVEDLE